MYLINGKESEFISLSDRALHYGDGLFETIAVKDGQLLCLAQHYQRLQLGCDVLNIECPSLDLLHEESRRLCLERDKGVIKWLISRGAGGRGYQPPPIKQLTTRIVGSYDWPGYPGNFSVQGIELCVCRTRMGHSPVLAGIKHLNRLEQVMLRQEIAERGFHEGIVLDIAENVIEGSMSNLFLIRDNNLITPELNACGVNGVIRKLILENAYQWDLDARITVITMDDVYESDEMFLCNSIIGIWPVVKIAQQQKSIGPITQKIRQQLVADGIIVSS